VLIEAFIGPGVRDPQGIDNSQLQSMDLGSHLKDSLWTPELGCALEKFSLSTYLDWLDRLPLYDREDWYYTFPEAFFNYLKAKVSIPCNQVLAFSLC